MGASLYDRMGGHDKLEAIAKTIFANHMGNDVVRPRYEKSDPAEVVRKVTEFMCAGFGGKEEYTGQDMLTAHKGMNISDTEFNAVVNDVILALDEHQIGQVEKDEVLCALWSMRQEIVHV